MPTYEFACENGHRFDRFYRKISDAPSELVCPECGAVALRQVSGGAGLLFKGSGFYITDYGKDGKKGQKSAAKSESSGGGESKSDGGAKGEGGGKGESKSDSASKGSESKGSSSGGSTSGPSGPSGSSGE